MKTINNIIWAVVCFTLVLGCTRRPLDDDPGDTALVPIRIDWTHSMLDMNTVHNVSLWFFPHEEGRTPLEYRMEDNLTETVIPLPVGVYSVVVFNETVDDSYDENSSLIFSGQERYETFCVGVKDDATRLGRMYSRSDNTLPKRTPLPLASWSLDRFEVTWDMVVVTRTRSKAKVTKSLASYTVTRTQQELVDLELESMLSVVPLPRTRRVVVAAYVENVKAAANATGQLDGATERVSLATGLPVLGIVTHAFALQVAAVKPDVDHPDNGTIESSFFVFDHQSEPTYTIDLNFQLRDGSWVKPNDVFEVTSQVDKEVFEIKINVGSDPHIPEPDPEHPRPPIQLPDPINNSVGVGEWLDEEIILGTR